MNQVELYRTPDGTIELQVSFDQETVWLTQRTIAELFDKDSDTIGLHLRNIYADEELNKDSTTEEFSVVQFEGKRQVRRIVVHYNLDAIISVGYRVNSKRGTHFRQWATKRLRDYLVKGVAVNQMRLTQLQQTIQLVKKSADLPDIEVNAARGMIDLLDKYSDSMILLSQYDNQTLQETVAHGQVTFEIEYNEAVEAITGLRSMLIEKGEASALFGNEKDESFKSSLRSVVQTFDGQYLYPTIEQQAAMLLYFIIKNRSFTDGNKRIGAFIFVWFLERNCYSINKDSQLKISSNALIALTLLVAQSRPEEKDMIIALIINLIA